MVRGFRQQLNLTTKLNSFRPLMVGLPLFSPVEAPKSLIQTTAHEQTWSTPVEMVVIYHITTVMVMNDIYFLLKCENIFGYCPSQSHSQESETFFKAYNFTI